jgi:hypothetical protein
VDSEAQTNGPDRANESTPGVTGIHFGHGRPGRTDPDHVLGVRRTSANHRRSFITLANVSVPSAPPAAASPSRRVLLVRVGLLALIGLFGVYLVIQGLITTHATQVSSTSVGSTGYERAIAEVIIGGLFVVVDLALIAFVSWIRPSIVRAAVPAREPNHQ